MTKITIVHDTILIIQRDTITKLLKTVTEPKVPKLNEFIEHFNLYSNFYTALGTIFTFIAIAVSLYAINQSTKLTRKQVLVGKLEEICESINSLQMEYTNFYDMYTLLEKIQNSSNNLVWLRTQLNQELQKIELDSYIYKLSRLNVLVNAYLGDKTNKSKTDKISEQKALKFKTIGFIELYNALILVLKFQDLKMKEHNFIEPFPTTESISKLVKELNNSIISLMGYGGDSEGYILYRNTIFKEDLGMLPPNTL